MTTTPKMTVQVIDRWDDDDPYERYVEYAVLMDGRDTGWRVERVGTDHAMLFDPAGSEEADLGTEDLRRAIPQAKRRVAKAFADLATAFPQRRLTVLPTL